MDQKNANDRQNNQSPQYKALLIRNGYGGIDNNGIDLSKIIQQASESLSNHTNFAKKATKNRVNLESSSGFILNNSMESGISPTSDQKRLSRRGDTQFKFDQGYGAYVFRLHINQTASNIKVTKNQKVLQSPDDIRDVQLKKSELNWIFKNVKNSGIQKQINYYHKDLPTGISNMNQNSTQIKRAVIILNEQQLLIDSSKLLQQDSSAKSSPIKRARSLPDINELTKSNSQGQCLLNYMQVIPKQIKKKKGQPVYSGFKQSNTSIVHNSINSMISNNTTNLNFNINININKQDTINKYRSKKTESKFKDPSKNLISQSDSSLSEATLIKKGTEYLTYGVMKDLQRNAENYLGKQDQDNSLQSDLSQSDSDSLERSERELKLTATPLNNQKPAKIKLANKIMDKKDNRDPIVRKKNKLKNHRQNEKNLNNEQNNEQSKGENKDLQRRNTKVNTFFYHNDQPASPNKTNKHNPKIDDSSSLDFPPLNVAQKKVNPDQISKESSKKHTHNSPQKSPQAQKHQNLDLKVSKWAKIKHLFGGLLRFRTQEAIKIYDPDQIIDEISKQSAANYTATVEPTPTTMIGFDQKNKKKDTNNIVKQSKKDLLNLIEDNFVNQNQLKIDEEDSKQDLEDSKLNIQEEALLIGKQKKNESPVKKKNKPQPPPKVREIDYFRKIRRFFEYAARGSHKDEKRLLRELKNDIRKHMWTKNDPMHLINIKNVFGQTPLYVACKSGNLNIVKLLINNGANVLIKSSIEKDQEENNLQVAARWSNFEIVKYLIENIDWPKQDLKDAIQTQGVQQRIRNMLIDHYRNQIKMGNSDSTQQVDDYAYRVIAVLPGSPAEQVDIEAQLDFIRYNPEFNQGKLFSEYLAENEGKELPLFVYNIIQQDNRLVTVKIHRDWGEKNSLLGTTIRYECYSDAHNNILAVNDVYLSSPAHEAGIQPFKDYILGTREISFKNLDQFAKYIEVNQGNQIKLYIYNLDQEQVREVLLTPRPWNGQGLLGCDVSFGFFNKIPLRKKDVERMQNSGLKSIFGKLTGEETQTLIPVNSVKQQNEPSSQQSEIKQENQLRQDH